MIDLNKIMNESLEKVEKNGFVNMTIENAIEKTIESVVSDVFSWGSPFYKNLDEYIKSNLNVNFGELDLTGYNMLVVTAVKEHLDKTLKNEGIEKLKKRMDDMLQKVKEEYTLSEIIEKFKNDKFINFEDEDEITLRIEGSAPFCYIYLDSCQGKDRYNCDYMISLNESIPFRVKIAGKDTLETKDILNNFIGFNDFLFKIYAAGSKIVLDEGKNEYDYDLEIVHDCED